MISNIIRSKNAIAIIKYANKFIFFKVYMSDVGLLRRKSNVNYRTILEGLLLPIEVKSVDNTKAKSLPVFCNRYSPKMAIETSLKNLRDNMDGDTHVWSIPLYAFFRLKEYVAHEMGW